MDPDIFAEVSSLDADRSLAWFLVVGGFGLAAASGVLWLVA